MGTTHGKRLVARNASRVPALGVKGHPLGENRATTDLIRHRRDQFFFFFLSMMKNHLFSITTKPLFNIIYVLP